MEDGDNNGTPPDRKVTRFRRFQQLRGIRSKVDQMLRSYWQQRIAEGALLAEAAVERAFERYAKNGPPADAALGFTCNLTPCGAE